MSDQGRAQTASSVVGEMIAPLVAEARELRAVVSNDNATRRNESRRLMAIVVVLFLMVGGLLTMVVQNRIRADESREILRRTVETNHQIIDCTSPDGTCYQQGQERTADIIGTLVASNIAVHRCVEANHDGTAEQIHACVMKALKTP